MVLGPKVLLLMDELIQIVSILQIKSGHMWIRLVRTKNVENTQMVIREIMNMITQSELSGS